MKRVCIIYLYVVFFVLGTASTENLTTTLNKLQRVLTRLQSKELTITDNTIPRPNIPVDSKCANGPDAIDKVTKYLFPKSCVAECLRTSCKKQCLRKNANKTVYRKTFRKISNNTPVQLQSGCYIFKNEAIATYSNAVQECSKYGMSLLSLETVHEANVVIKHLAKIHGNSKEFAYWTSATSLVKRKTYRWNTKGSEILKELWHHNEPNEGRVLGVEQCVVLVRWVKIIQVYRIALADVSCDTFYFKTGVICEQK